ncbi:site-specific integrase [Liquorilactobacillus vini]|uniref:site-specific integrase n=1 Tax=Liquorilactobacillus vini TaxID=238015 RepID=UPI001F45B271|nr:site-specific integrase [Liquorilactobacillus vini]
MNKRDPKQEYYTKNELRQFLKCAYDFDNYQAYTFFRLLAFSGIRKGEALALDWNNVDFKSGKIKINKTQSNGDNRLVVQTTKTENSDREIYIDSKTISILHHWKQEQRIKLFAFGFNSDTPNQLVFASAKNEMHNPNKPRVWLHQICRKYVIKTIPIHGFRHTYATLAIEGGIQPKQLQEQLGPFGY